MTRGVTTSAILRHGACDALTDRTEEQGRVLARDRRDRQVRRLLATTNPPRGGGVHCEQSKADGEKMCDNVQYRARPSGLNLEQHFIYLFILCNRQQRHPPLIGEVIMTVDTGTLIHNKHIKNVMKRITI